MNTDNHQSKRDHCLCGSTFRKGDMARHKKSLKHQQWMRLINSPQLFWSFIGSKKTNKSFCSLVAYHLYEHFCSDNSFPIESEKVFYQKTKELPDIAKYLDYRSWRFV
jgi:hypothetical protein